MDSGLPERRIVYSSLAGRSANIVTRPNVIADYNMLRLVGAVSALLCDNVSDVHLEDRQVSKYVSFIDIVMLIRLVSVTVCVVIRLVNDICYGGESGEAAITLPEGEKVDNSWASTWHCHI